jgi:hypothetical protein
MSSPHLMQDLCEECSSMTCLQRVARETEVLDRGEAATCYLFAYGAGVFRNVSGQFNITWVGQTSGEQSVV